jgi:hypothetical protein
MKITLNNLTDWRNQDVRKAVVGIARDLRLKGDITFLFQAIWTEIDGYGEVIPDTEQDIGYDGTPTTTA